MENISVYYQLDVEVWKNSFEARKEALRVLSQEAVPKNDLLLAKYLMASVATLQSRVYSLIEIAYKSYCRKLMNISKKSEKMLYVPIITLVVEQKEENPTEEEILQLQAFLINTKSLFHRFMLVPKTEPKN